MVKIKLSTIYISGDVKKTISPEVAFLVVAAEEILLLGLTRHLSWCLQSSFSIFCEPYSRPIRNNINVQHRSQLNKVRWSLVSGGAWDSCLVYSWGQLCLISFTKQRCFSMNYGNLNVSQVRFTLCIFVLQCKKVEMVKYKCKP